MPSRVSAFLSNFVKAKNKKRRFYLRSWICRLRQVFVALVLKSWNQIVEHLEKWRTFAIDLVASDSPQEDESHTSKMKLPMSRSISEDRWQEPQVSY